MKKLSITTGMLALAMWALPSTASALTCPLALDGVITRTYTVDPALACAWGDGFISQGQDDFLAGNIDGSIGTVGTNWTNVEYTETGGNGAVLDVNSNGTWTLTGANLANEYLIGLEDGGNPAWAVFRIAAGVLAGTWDITTSSGSDRGALQHIALYTRAGGGQGGGDAPEPASLTLFGLALLGAANRIRKRRRVLS